MRVPTNLAGWTLKAIEELCAAGLSESDRHDFKFGLPDAENTTKLCCAFANSFGGFIVLGVKEDQKSFKIVGVDPDPELYGKLLAKIRTVPNIEVSLPTILAIPASNKKIYVFEIPQSPRRPHLPSPVDERTFWKRQGSSCTQMTLEEIRLQMINYEEKREKLALLLMDLSHTLRSLNEQANYPDDRYDGAIFTFDIVDRVVADSYSILREDIQSIGVLNTLRKSLQFLNAEKAKLLQILAMSYAPADKTKMINHYRDQVKQIVPQATAIVEQVERSFREKFGITNPYKLNN